MNKLKPIILVINDIDENINLISSLLKNLYEVKSAPNGEKALAVARIHLPNLIIIDVMKSNIDGYETCRCLKMEKKLKNIPVIFLIEKSEVGDEYIGIKMGAVDYIEKPINKLILFARVKTHLELKRLKDYENNKSLFLELEISRRKKDCALLQEASIMSMAALAETRDNETGRHIQRTKLYVKELAQNLSKTMKYKNVLTSEILYWIVESAPLHDIGKVGVPDYILLKPSALTAEEFEIIKTHTVIGRDAIIKAEELMGNTETFLKYAREIAYYHHERWDGKGYMNGLKGEEIPISARIMAVADVYDALTSKRLYKAAFSHEKAVEIITKDSGKHFDPYIVEVFLKIEHRFEEIKDNYKDLIR